MNKISKTGLLLEFGKFNYIFILISGVMFMTWFYEFTGIVYYLPVAECDLNITSKQDYAIVSGVTYVGSILSFFLWGFLADTRGRKKVLLPTISVALVFTFATSLAKSFWIFVLLRFFNGFL